MNVLLLQVGEPGRDRDAAQAVTQFLGSYWPVVLPCLLGFVGVYLLLPRARRFPPLPGVIAGAAALLAAGLFLVHATGPWPEAVLFHAFAGLAVLSGGLMVTQSNPVYAALSFALVVLSTCGLFLLQAAPFLMAATIIIYAGAIVVTFLFVIMLAQQEGHSSADLRSREPFLGALAGFVLLAATLCSVQRAMATPELDRVIDQLRRVADAGSLEEANRVLGAPPRKDAPGFRTLRLVDDAKAALPPGDEEGATKADLVERSWAGQQLEPLRDNARAVAARLVAVREDHGSLTGGPVRPGQDRVPGHPEAAPGRLPHHNVAGLGRLLFTEYLVPVELAAVLLLVATIGAIVIAGRHSEALR